MPVRSLLAARKHRKVGGARVGLRAEANGYPGLRRGCSESLGVYDSVDGPYLEGLVLGVASQGTGVRAVWIALTRPGYHI